MTSRLRQRMGFASVLLVVAWATGCAPVRVHAFAEPGVRFSFRTYAWASDPQTSTGDPRLDNNRFFSERVRDAVDRGLAVRGLEKVALGSSDLVVHYSATITQEIEPSAPVDRSEHCYNCGPTIYDAGSLVIDLVDARTEKLIWRGWAEHVDPVIDNQDWMDMTIDRVVAEILKNLPARS